MGNWAPHDLHAAMVALFILIILWWLTLFPKFKHSSLTTSGGDEDRPKRTRSHHAFSMARDAVTLLTASLLIAYAGAANRAAVNTLSFLYMALYIITVALAYWSRSRILLTSLQALAFSLMFALIITALASAVGRGISGP